MFDDPAMSSWTKDQWRDYAAHLKSIGALRIETVTPEQYAPDGGAGRCASGLQLGAKTTACLREAGHDRPHRDEWIEWG